MKVQTIPLDDLKPNAWNPNVLDDRKLEALKKQIGRVGFRQPIVVRPLAGGGFEIIDGEHRVRALRELGEKTVECVVVEDDDIEAKTQTLAMNVLRGEPDILRMAHLIVDLEEKLPAAELADRLGLTESQVRDFEQIGREDVVPVEELGRERKEIRTHRMLVFEFDREIDYELVNGSIEKVRKHGKRTVPREDALLEIVRAYNRSKPAVRK